MKNICRYWGIRVSLPMLFFLLLGFGHPLMGRADQEIVIHAQEQLQYAETCFLEEDYGTAVSEYKRFAFFFSTDYRIEYVHYRIGLSLFRAGQYSDSIQYFKKFEEAFGDTPYTRKGGFLTAQSYLALDQKGGAVLSLNGLTETTTDDRTKDQALYELGWIWLEHPSYLLSKDENEQHAFSYFEKVSPEGQARFRLLELRKALDRYEDLSEKNPTLAGALSIIPGLGQLYCERYQDSLTAFLLNAAFGITVYEALDHENYALAGLIGAAGIGFYGGNIYGAVSSAHKHNRALRGDFMDSLKQKVKVTISSTLKEKDLRITFGSAF